jgi:probable HAF family extracellular repeat protein
MAFPLDLAGTTMLQNSCFVPYEAMEYSQEEPHMRSRLICSRRDFVLSGLVASALLLLAGCGSGGSNSTDRNGEEDSDSRYRVTDLGPASAYAKVQFNRAGDVVAIPSDNAQAFLRFDQRSAAFTPTDAPGSLKRFGPNTCGQRLELLEPKWQYESKTLIQPDGTRVDMSNFGKSKSGYSPSRAEGINDAGQIIGDHAVPDPESGRIETHGFLWHDGTFTDLGTLGGSISHVYDINQKGQIVGYSTRAERNEHGLEPYRPFLYENGQMTELPVLSGSPVPNHPMAKKINERGQIVGSDGYRVFFWENGMVRDLTVEGGDPGFASPLFLNEGGQIIGEGITYVIAAGSMNGQPMPTMPEQKYFFYDGTQTHTMESLLPSNRTLKVKGVGGLNDAGEVLMVATEANAEERWFLLTPRN